MPQHAQPRRGRGTVTAIYARKSTEQHGADAEAKSVARQIESARAFAVSKGWTVDETHVYGDDAVSGADVRRLVNRQRLLDAIQAGPPFQAVIMRDASRFSRRDGDEAFGELKAIARAGVDVWFYQEGQRFEYGNFAANITGFVKAEMNAEFRRQIAKWTRDAMLKKAQAGHVTGGRVFGYDNERVNGHVERRINEAEAAIVRQVFTWAAEGAGTKTIAKRLNDARALCPRAQRGRPNGWAPSSVREVFRRSLYRGVITWDRTKARDEAGERRMSRRPERDWLTIPAEHLRIVPESLGNAAHRRMAQTAAQYLRTPDGQVHGRPPNGVGAR